MGNITSIVDPKGNERRYTYDSLSRKRHVEDPNAGSLDLIYDDAGNLTERLNAVGQKVTAEYGQQSRLLATRVWRAGASAPERSYEFGYDIVSDSFREATNLRGQVAWVSDSVSKTSMSYDEMGRAVAQLREVWDPTKSLFEAQQRDVFRRKVVLDAQGKPTSVEMPGGFAVAYGYNERSLMKTVRAGFGGVKSEVVPSFAYDAQGGLVRSDYGNGTTNCRWFDARHRIVGRKAAPTASLGCVSRESDSTAFQQLAYGYTVHGLLESVVDKTAPRADGVRFDATYQYDRLYELTATTTAEGRLGYRYDVIQNLISQTATQADTGLPLGDFKYGEGGAGPNALTRVGMESFGYDAAGRMRAYHGFALDWDAQDKLVSATRADGSRVENYYDGDGERVVEVVRRPGKSPEVHRYVFGDYLLHGTEPTWVVTAGAVKAAEVSETAGLVPTLWQLDELVAYSLDTTRRPLPASRELLDFDGNGTLADVADLAVAARRYVEGAAEGKPTRVWRHYHEDHLGAPTHVSDSAGEWASATRFHPYGRPYGKRGDQAEYGYAGSQREPVEEFGLMRMGARWYAADVGRWVSADQLFVNDPAANLKKPLEGSNLYGYVAGSPVNATDLAGTDAVYLAFPDYKISAYGRQLSNLGHAGVLLIDNKTGQTRYYEYGRYKSEQGNVERRGVPDVKIGKGGRPTAESLKAALAEIAKKAGHGGRVEGAYVPNGNYKDMVKYAEDRMLQNSNPARDPYSIWNNNCGTFARDAIRAGTANTPAQVDPRPNSYIKEMQNQYPRVAFNPATGAFAQGPSESGSATPAASSRPADRR